MKKALAVLEDNAAAEIASDDLQTYTVVRVADEVLVRPTRGCLRRDTVPAAPYPTLFGELRCGVAVTKLRKEGQNARPPSALAPRGDHHRDVAFPRRNRARAILAPSNTCVMWAATLKPARDSHCSTTA